MDIPQIRLWERSAMRPGDCSPFLWLRRTPPESLHPRDQQLRDLALARRNRRRTRAATGRGLLFSMFLCFPVGGAYALSSPLNPIVSDGQQCKSLSATLGPANQRRLLDYRRSHGLTTAQQSALDKKVCDSGILNMIPSLAASITDAEGFEEMARKLEGMGDEVNTMSVLKLFFSGGGEGR